MTLDADGRSSCLLDESRQNQKVGKARETEEERKVGESGRKKEGGKRQTEPWREGTMKMGRVGREEE